MSGQPLAHPSLAPPSSHRAIDAPLEIGPGEGDGLAGQVDNLVLAHVQRGADGHDPGLPCGQGTSAPTAPGSAGQAGLTLHPGQLLPSTATDTFLLCSSPGTLGAITLQLTVLGVSKVRFSRVSCLPSPSSLPCWEGMSTAMSSLCPCPKGVQTSQAQ